MNRRRLPNHQERDMDSAGPSTSGARPVRKNTIVRPDLQRPPQMAKPARLSRQVGMMSRSPERKPATGSHFQPNPLERPTTRRCNSNFLPRVATLSTNNNNNRNNNMQPQGSATRSKSVVQKYNITGTFPNDMKHLASPRKPQLQQTRASNNLAGIHGSTSSLNSSSSYVGAHKTQILPAEQNQSFVYLCKPVKEDMKELLYPSDEEFDDELDELGLSVDSGSDTQRSDELQMETRKRLQENHNEHEPKQEQEQEQEKAANKETEQEPKPNLEQLQKQKIENELELVCKSIPTLQREIRLLQELSEQLEVTITAGQRPPNEILQVDQKSSMISWHSVSDRPSDDSHCTFYTPRSNFSLFAHEQLPIVHIGWRCVEMRAVVKHRVTGRLNVRNFGNIQEFRIETKTLTELKTADEQQVFYMPLAEDGGLQRTSFRLLREQPNLLLKQLRPLIPARPFNLLEQDAMFFHHMLSYGDPALEQQKLLPCETGGAQQQPLEGFGSLRSVHGQRAEVNWSSADVELMLTNLEKAKLKLQLLLPSTISQTLRKDQLSAISMKRYQKALHLLCSKHKPRHRPRPVPPVKTFDRCCTEFKPQRRLLKTVIRIVQVAVFVVLVSAFVYPDISC